MEQEQLIENTNRTPAPASPLEFQNAPIYASYESQTNPRRRFDEASLAELAESIRQHGVLVPLLVRHKLGSSLNSYYEIVAGARRYRAARMAGVDKVPVHIKNLTDAQVLELQIVENLQREDVHPIEEADGFSLHLHLEVDNYSTKTKLPADLVGAAQRYGVDAAAIERQAVKDLKTAKKNKKSKAKLQTSAKKKEDRK